MEILRFVQKYLNYKDTHTKIIIFSLYSVVLALHLWSVFLCEQPLHLWLFAGQLILLAIIHIWVYSAPKFYPRFVCFEGAFPDNREYQFLCQHHQQWLLQFRIQNDESIWEPFLKVAYICLWVSTCACLIGSFRLFHLIPHSLLGNITIPLVIISLILNFSSYYSCIVFSYFLRKVSNIPDLKHNRFIPSSTWGFQRLSSTASVCSMTFLLVSLLYTILYSMFLLSIFQQPPSLSSQIIAAIQQHPVDFGFMSFLIAALGILTFFIVLLVPKVFLRRILGKWKEKSLKQFEAELYLAEAENNCLGIEKSIQHINMLCQDNLKLKVNVFEILVSASTFAINAVGIISFFIKLDNIGV